MARFVVTLSEEHRAKLDAVRARMGLRSEADTVRRLIEDAAASREILSPVEQVAADVYAAEHAASFRAVPYGSRLKKR